MSHRQIEWVRMRQLAGVIGAVSSVLIGSAVELIAGGLVGHSLDYDEQVQAPQSSQIEEQRQQLID